MISFFINRPARLLAVLLTGLVVAPGPKRVLAQSLTWNDISGRLGFSVLTGLSDGTLFARYDFILYRSTDDGETWINFPRPGGPILEFVTRGSTALLVVGRYNAADYKQYFISTDRAENWSRIYTEGSGGTVHTNIMLSADETVYGLYPRGSK
ncbi:MAG TPA: hypothetical protein VJO14_05385, partial [Bacteroidota bacterium]|nr:hypothetical protein [Bacteroidota bacterium]